MNYIAWNNTLTYFPHFIALSVCIFITKKIYNLAKSLFDEHHNNRSTINILRKEKESLSSCNEILKSQITSLEKENRDTRNSLNTITEEVVISKRQLLYTISTFKNAYVYDRKLLQQSYLFINKNNPRRTKPLKIIKLEKNDSKLKYCLENWFNFCVQKQNENQGNPITLKKYSLNRTIVHLIYDGITRSLIDDKDRITALMDEHHEMQGICVSTAEKTNLKSWKIKFLVSSPLNIRDGDKHSVEGAGTALIQDVVEQVFKQINSNLDLPQTIVEDEISVTLSSIPDAISFYKHIGFNEIGGYEMILTGKSLVEFIHKYAGRYTA